MTGQRTARHWIGGEWVDQGPQRHSFNPADGKVIGTYCDGGAQAAEAAIEKCCTMSSDAP